MLYVCSCSSPPLRDVFQLGHCSVVACSAPATIAQNFPLGEVFLSLDSRRALALDLGLAGVVIILFQGTALLSFLFVLVCVYIKLVHLKSLRDFFLYYS